MAWKKLYMKGKYLKKGNGFSTGLMNSLLHKRFMFEWFSYDGFYTDRQGEIRDGNERRIYMEVIEILKSGIEKGCSDIFVVPGCPVSMKINGIVLPFSDEKVRASDAEEILHDIYKIENNRSMDTLLKTGDDDFSFSLKGTGRFRCNAYRQRGSLAAVLRVVAFGLPDPEAMQIPDGIMDLSQRRKGLVLITGPAGSGKSTTLACMTDQINRERNAHIITIEDPIEFIHLHNKSIVSQREISQDTESYNTALKAALRQAPNVLLLGEMRDFETIQTALTAAETGQLVLSTMHTLGAAKTIERIIDVFPENQQQQIRTQLSITLEAVVSQQLIPGVGGGLEPAFEIMFTNSDIQNMIKEGKCHQIDNAVCSGASQGMTTMDAYIMDLYKKGKISRENAVMYSMHPEIMIKKLG